MIVVLGSVTTLAVASQRIKAEQAAFRAPAAARCYPSTLNRSATLPGTSVSVSPLPDSYDASARTQISLLGAPRAALSRVHVSGSDSGSHSGRLRAYSQGDGASFVPSKPFSPGETVTVRGEVTAGARAQRFAYHFTSPRQDALPYSPADAAVGHGLQREAALPLARRAWKRRRWPSRAQLPAERARRHLRRALLRSRAAGPDDLRRSRQPRVVRPAATSVAAATNLQVQQLGGKPVLTWWQGYIPPQGFGEGEEIIDNTAYQQIGRVHAGNGYKADLHDFHIDAAGHGAADGVRPDRLQPVARRRPARRRGDRQRLPGNRPAHGARAARVAQPRPRRRWATPTARRRPPARNGRSTTSTSTRSTSAPTARR